ncbi:MAG: DUF2442 domain-containing protein [Desulfonauticus sp.]|nr:DUF2442 domain-containing protein [Desulfonauticus sp.]
MYLGVKEVQALDDYKLKLKFENNEERIFDLKPYLNLGKFSELQDQELLKKVRVSFDTIEWPNGIDLDPEFLYKHSKNET